MAELVLGKSEMEGQLPSICIRCGAPATAWVEKSFELPDKDEQFVGFGLVSRIRFFLKLGQSFARPRLLVRAPFCEAHKQHWYYRKLIIFGGLGAWFVLFILSIIVSKVAGGGLEVLLAIAFITGLAYGVAAVVAHETSIHSKETTENGVTLKGVADQFKDLLEAQRAHK